MHYPPLFLLRPVLIIWIPEPSTQQRELNQTHGSRVRKVFHSAVNHTVSWIIESGPLSCTPMRRAHWQNHCPQLAPVGTPQLQLANSAAWGPSSDLVAEHGSTEGTGLVWASLKPCSQHLLSHQTRLHSTYGPSHRKKTNARLLSLEVQVKRHCQL